MIPAAIVTGASRGIGRAIALRLAAEGYSVALVARPSAELNEAAAFCGPRALTLPADVASPADVESAVRRAAGSFGRIDALLNVAGDAPVQSIADMSCERFRRTIEVNLCAPFYFMKFAWPHLKASGRGVVVNFSSMASRDPFGGFAAYAAAKAGVNLLSLCGAREGNADGVLVHTLAPGAVETGMLRAIVSPEQLSPQDCLKPDEVADVAFQCVAGHLRHASGEVIYLRKSPV